MMYNENVDSPGTPKGRPGVFVYTARRGNLLYDDIAFTVPDNSGIGGWDSDIGPG